MNYVINSIFPLLHTAEIHIWKFNWDTLRYLSELFKSDSLQFVVIFPWHIILHSVALCLPGQANMSALYCGPCERLYISGLPIWLMVKEETIQKVGDKIARLNHGSMIPYIFTDLVYTCSTWWGTPSCTFVQFDRSGRFPLCKAGIV